MSAVSSELVVVRTPRLVLREKTLEDAVDEFNWRRDPETAEFNATRPVSGSFSQFLEQFDQDLRLVDPTRRALAIDAADGTHIGSVMYYNGNHVLGAFEYGIGIYDKRYRGAGMGTEATVAFLRWGWVNLPFRRAYLHTLAWNDRAHRCFQRAGFEETNRLYRFQQAFIRMEAQREWWLLWDAEGRFADCIRPPADSPDNGSS